MKITAIELPFSILDLGTRSIKYNVIVGKKTYKNMIMELEVKDSGQYITFRKAKK